MCRSSGSKISSAHNATVLVIVDQYAVLYRETIDMITVIVFNPYKGLIIYQCSHYV